MRAWPPYVYLGMGRSLPGVARGDRNRERRAGWPAVMGRARRSDRDQLRTWRSRRFWKRSTWPAVSMIVCLPVKNGWQLPHTSTRNSGRVEPTVHSVPHEPQWTLRFVILGMDIGLHEVLSSDAVRAGPWPSRWSPAVSGV